MKKVAAENKHWQLKCPPKWCKTCEQDSHTFDCHGLPKQELLPWHKFSWDELMEIWKCDGNECYRCFDTRRKKTDGQTMDDVIESKKSPEGLAYWLKWRKAKATAGCDGSSGGGCRAYACGAGYWPWRHPIPAAGAADWYGMRACVVR